MKKESNITGLILLVLLLLWGCADDAPRSPSARTQAKEQQSNTQVSDSIAQQRGRWVDYINYTISSYALRDNTTHIAIFETLTKDDKSYGSVLAALRKINETTTSNAAEANIALCNEVNNLKNDAILQKSTDTLPVYFSHDIFLDTVKYKKIAAFYKKRAEKRADQQPLAKMQESIKKNMQDSIANVVKVNKPVQSELTTEIINEQNSGKYIPWILCFIAGLAAAGITTQLMRKKSTAKNDTKDIDTNELIKKLQAEKEEFTKKVQKLEADNQNLENKIKEFKQAATQRMYTDDAPHVTDYTQKSQANILYFPAPNGNSFPSTAGNSSKRSVDIYQVEVEGSKARLNLLVADSDVVKRVLDSPAIYILPLYEIEANSAQFNRATSIKILEAVLLQQEAGQWALKTKGLIKLM